MRSQVSKRTWIRMFAKIARQAERQLMDPQLRGHPMFSAQNRVYLDKAFQKRLRCCICEPRCVIGGRCSDVCACAAENRHEKERVKLRERVTAHAERSTRVLHNKYRGAGGGPRVRRMQTGRTGMSRMDRMGTRRTHHCHRRRRRSHRRQLSQRIATLMKRPMR